MSTTFKLNGKTVIAKPFDYGMVCDLEDMGASIGQIHEKPNSVIRAYVGVCLGIDKDAATKEINAHVLNGGSIKPIVDAMNKELEDSDFFQKLNKTEEEETQPNQE